MESTEEQTFVTCTNEPRGEEQTFVECTNIGINETSLNSYHCVCGKLVLIVNKPLKNLPLRKTDMARVVDSKKHIYKIICDPQPETVHILRRKGVEKQYRFKCKQCNLPVFYKHDTKNGVTFILKNAVIETCVSEVVGKGNKNGQTQITRARRVFRDSRAKIGGIRLPSYKENYKIIRYALEKEDKWGKTMKKTDDSSSSK